MPPASIPHRSREKRREGREEESDGTYINATPSPQSADIANNATQRNRRYGTCICLPATAGMPYDMHSVLYMITVRELVSESRNGGAQVQVR